MKILALALAIPCFAQTPAPAPAAPPTFTFDKVLDRQVGNLERQLVPLVEAMPAEKYDFAPTTGEFKGVKTFAQQVRHVAAANYLFASGILLEKSPLDLGEDEGAASFKTKAEIVKLLKDSFAYVHKAMASVTDKSVIEPIKAPWGAPATRLALAILTASHGMDHYGQMVVYLRMNGIVPPASRKP